MKNITYPALYDHQLECIEKVVETLKTDDRCKVIMACGTGKTRLGSEIAIAIKAKSVVVYLPSLALISQTIPQWVGGIFDNTIHYLCVCSDQTVTNSTEEVNMSAMELIDDLGIPSSRVTTKKDEIKSFLSKDHGAISVVFCTYHSCDLLSEAMPEDYCFDMGVFDEAHKTAGQNTGFSAPLSNQHTNIAKRVFMTATPKHYDVKNRDRSGEAKLSFSMDNKDVYGDTAYNLPIRKAIELGIIAGYQLIISVVDNAEVAKSVRNDLLTQDNAQLIAHAIAIKSAMTKYNLTKVVTFHGSIESAAYFAGNPIVQRELEIPTYHVNGLLSTKERSSIMEQFSAGNKGLVTNARCLTEGVDVPSIDLVAFLHPKKSQIDIIQAIGRSLRKPIGSDKVTGYILLPLYVSSADKGGLEVALEEYGYDTIYQVVQALREQDELVEQSLQAYKINAVQGDRNKNKELDFLKFDIQSDGFQADRLRNIISTKIVNYLIESWYDNFALLQEIYLDTGSANIEKRTKYKGNNIGFWTATQRAYYKHNLLPDHKIKLLESIGFSWNKLESSWDAHYAELKKVWEETGVSHVRDSTIINGMNIGVWILDQRKLYKSKKMNQTRIEKLLAIDFTFDYKGNVWMGHFNILKQYYEVNGHSSIPNNYIQDNVKLGSWLSEQKKNYKRGKLSDSKTTMLNSLNIKWNILEDRWNESFNLLKEYVQIFGFETLKEGTFYKGFSLNKWFWTQKKLSLEGQLLQHRARAIESLGVQMVKENNSWEENFADFCEYWKRVSGVHNRKDEFFNNKARVTWLFRQRSNYKLGKINSKKLEQLNSINFPF